MLKIFLALSILLFFFACTPRTGEEIYKTVFGETTLSYSILNAQDHTNPMDCCIWLQIKAEKEEILRITQLYQYPTTPLTNVLSLPEAGQGEVPSWFNPSELEGGFEVTFSTNEQQSHWQTFYISKDTTEVYVRDATS